MTQSHPENVGAVICPLQANFCDAESAPERNKSCRIPRGICAEDAAMGRVTTRRTSPASARKIFMLLRLTQRFGRGRASKIKIWL